MKIVIAIDSFKGSLSSLEAASSIKDGIVKVMKDAEIKIYPLADGGEGTVDALTSGMGGRKERIAVTGPLGEKVNAEYGILPDGKTAVIEVASAAGITLIEKEERDPLLTTTYGVGEIISDAIRKGCRHFIIGLGGSVTNDGGIGMLQALGYGILDEHGDQVCPGAKGLKDIDKITAADRIPELMECDFRVACDVSNPLCGEQGCSQVFGPQKGAAPSVITEMDEWLDHYASVSKSVFPESDKNTAGTGAAGGLGFAFLTYTNAVLESGIKIVLEETKLEDAIKEADLLITGEGRLDGQTVMGKAPIGAAALAKKHGKKVIAIAGSLAEDASICNSHGIDAYFPIVRGITTLEEAMRPEHAKANMQAAAEQVFRLIDAFS